ncbi:rCG59665, isoform CRA_a [Rattus norvegicus]|uniref:RCG59665, isoform CRA_a n=1 Tax=Rattus norvegicus TaxID=10116 RepID=A6HTD7_RAT|nr:rCG59665, isoform CRA_a [Rattus norvegicus]EDM15586.1 rCG59665, isoform CRA_a [Rattus norvegicus]
MVTSTSSYPQGPGFCVQCPHTSLLLV